VEIAAERSLDQFKKIDNGNDWGIVQDHYLFLAMELGKLLLDYGHRFF